VGSSPQVVDWNSDGQRDLVSGDREGYYNVFIQQGFGLVAYYRMRAMLGDTIDVGNNSHPAVADWDRDGKKDLLLGSEEGYIRYYRNLATDTWPGFANYTYIQSSGSPIYIYRVNPYVVDLDQDGRRDLVCGADDGYLHYFHNIGSDTNPTFNREETLQTTYGTYIQPSGEIGSRTGFCDWNNDGVIDFLLSGYDGRIELYLGEGVGVEEKLVPMIPTNFRVAPNPTRSSVKISYSLSQPANVSLTVYDASGRLMASLESKKVGAGEHSIRWNPKHPAGVYLCKLTAGDLTITRRIVLTE